MCVGWGGWVCVTVCVCGGGLIKLYGTEPVGWNINIYIVLNSPPSVV